MEENATPDPETVQKKDIVKKSTQFHEHDYMWLVIFACFMSNCLSWGIAQSFGAFVVHFENYFDIPKSDIASIGSLSNGCLFMFGPIYGAFLNNFSCRQVATCGFLLSATGFLLSAIFPSINVVRITFILTGIGFGSAVTSVLSCIARFPPNRRGTAMGIAGIGVNVGTMCFAPIINILFQSYGLAGTMLIFSSIALNGVIFSTIIGISSPKTPIRNQQKCALKLQKIETIKNEPARSLEQYPSSQNTETIPRKEHSDKFCKEEYLLMESNIVCCSKVRNLLILVSKIFIDLKNSFNFHLLQSIPFIFACLGNLFTMLGLFIPLIFVPDAVVSKGIDKNKAVLLLSAHAIAGVPGKIISGYFADKSKMNAIHQFCIYLFISSLSLMSIPFLSDYVALMSVVSVFGFFIASNAILFALVVMEVVGGENFNSGLGISFVFCGLAITLGPPLIGFIYDVTRSYDVPFFLTAGYLVMSVLLYIFIPCLKRKENKAKP